MSNHYHLVVKMAVEHKDADAEKNGHLIVKVVVERWHLIWRFRRQ